MSRSGLRVAEPERRFSVGSPVDSGPLGSGTFQSCRSTSPTPPSFFALYCSGESASLSRALRGSAVGAPLASLPVHNQSRHQRRRCYFRSRLQPFGRRSGRTSPPSAPHPRRWGSGPLPNETDWETISRESGSTAPLSEHTSVTGRLRRIGRFDADVVRRAIAANQPTTIVMNHIDYVDAGCAECESLTEAARAFIRDRVAEIGAEIDLIGVGPPALVSFPSRLARVAS